MSDRDFLAKRFEEERPQLRRIAYRMLGTVDEADDAVQEAWLRLSRIDESSVENLGAWLTTVVSRVCLDFPRARERPHHRHGLRRRPGEARPGHDPIARASAVSCGRRAHGFTQTISAVPEHRVGPVGLLESRDLAE